MATVTAPKKLHQKLSIPADNSAKIKKIAQENPDLPLAFIEGILAAQQEVRAKKLRPYIFSL